MLERLQQKPLGDEGDWSAFRFEVENALAWTRLAGRSEAERELAAGMATMIAATDGRGLDSVKNAAAQLEIKERDTNGALYGLLATATKGRAHDMVRTEETGRCGVTTWVKLRDRFSKGEASSHMDVLRFVWPGGALEDKWRDFCRKVARLPEPLGPKVLESLVIAGCGENGATAVEEALRLKAPQAWEGVAGTVDRYLDTVRKDATPMDVGQVAQAPWRTTAGN